ncbi:hypothetical protein [Burkholderia cenocepacia]|uniref:hypothetical protein n=1 Tax=Burkholderia cenocepacia TaxID=95486 RepID=UPI00209AB49D|nr:hypothetical protein [Burkholderia cenocepacia]
MSYWRTFLVVVSLALSLPIQSFAAVSMQCASVAAPHEEKVSHAMPAAQDGHADHGDHARHASSCVACVSCCFGTGMSGGACGAGRGERRRHDRRAAAFGCGRVVPDRRHRPAAAPDARLVPARGRPAAIRPLLRRPPQARRTTYDETCSCD